MLQIFGQGCVAGGLVSVLLGQTAEGIVLDSHLVGELVLLLQASLDHHGVPTIHPGTESSLFHPVVHLAEQYFPVALGGHVFLVELLDRFEAFFH